jgi:hypothetical protein
MTTATLIYPIRDAVGVWHRPGDEVTVMGTLQQSQNSDKRLVKIVFDNQQWAYMYPSELKEAL